jgi:hypothetical protein
MNAWIPNTVTLQGLGTIPAAQTNYVISRKFPITAGGSKNIVVVVTLTSSGAGTYKVKLRSSFGMMTPVDSKEVTFAAPGAGAQVIYLKLNNDVSGDQTFLPLLSLGDVVIATPAGVTTTNVVVQTLQEE